MSFPTGTSDARGAPKSHSDRTPRQRQLGLIFCLLLAGLIGGVPFHTIDAFGVERVRTAFQVWGAVPPRLPQIGGPAVVHLVYVGALTVTILGSFALLWLAVATPQEQAPGVSRVAATRGWIAALLERSSGPGKGRAGCTALTLGIVAFAAWQLGAFAPASTFGVPDTFASFDHPFHVARAETLLRSIRDGESLRWVANHQGGYPAEFYPFGFAAFEILLWGLALGQLTIPGIHKIAVIILFLAPGLVFRAMARRDGWPPSVSLAAFALHVAVPGGMWHGGYSELVYMGLVANVSAALAVLASMAAAAAAFASGRRRPVAVAGVCAAAAIWCNPRSVVGLAACVGAAWLIALWRSGADARRATLQLTVIALIALLLAAPAVVPLIRYGDLYYFVRFTSYASSLEYLSASIDAVSLPAFALALVGLVTARLAARRRYLTATAALALLAYGAMTLLFSFGASGLVQQLEATRLMPVQRLLTVYLAGVGLHALGIAVSARTGLDWTRAAVESITIAALLFIFLGPDRLLPFWSRGLYVVQRSAVKEMAVFQRVLDIADRTAPTDTAILVVGSIVSTHQQLWAPARVPNRRYFYDYWMWYWHTQHRGPHDARSSTKYTEKGLRDIFDRDYLAFHGIGAVMVTPASQELANSSPHLERVFGGDYGLYAVKDPTSLVSFDGGRVASLTTANHRVTADGVSAGGEALVRQNYFPRWQATVNGKPVPVLRTEGGYMRVAIPPGSVKLVLTYSLDRADTAARAAAAGGLLLVVLLLLPSRVYAGGRTTGSCTAIEHIEPVK